MGMINCPVHGNQIVSFVSPKVADYVQKNKKADFDIGKLKLVLPGGKTSIHAVDINFYCSYQKNYELSNIDELIEDEEIAFEIFCELKPVCPDCFSKLVP